MEHETNTIDVGCLTVYDNAVFEAGVTSLEGAELQSKALKAYKLLLDKIKETKSLANMEQSLRKLEHQVIDFDKNPNEFDLPKAELPLPRLLKYDSTKVMTKWEKFAQEKGIQKVKKRSRMIWSEEVKDWVPRWGRNSAKHIKEDLDVIREVKRNQNPYEDPFKATAVEKSLALKKQNIREMENTLR
jgi:hypothetical protein